MSVLFNLHFSTKESLQGGECRYFYCFIMFCSVFLEHDQLQFLFCLNNFKGEK